MEDPYEILGVKRTATEKEIRSAYRKLAKTHHPDLNPGKPEAAERFKTISAANALLSDADKRARFDRGEIDATGAERPQERQFYRDFGETAGGAKYRAGSPFDSEDLEGIFAQAFGGQGFGGQGFGGQGFGGQGRAGRGFAAKGPDAQYSLTVDFLDAANGAVRRLTLPDGRTLDVTIPEGLQDGQVLRLKGQGMPGFGGGPAGDALIEVRVTPHPLFRRDGDDIVLDLPVTLKEAVLGAKVQVATLKGPVTLTIPPHSTTGTRLRLKNRGIAGGHQFVDLKVALPTGEEPELSAFLETWTPRHPFDPRLHHPSQGGEPS
ncbi:MAG TPA: DnaJ C-terminal domain-containing protein [Stellaceae bacterium]|nr:DnaJ C-terminal domain-containing protein [Stellaceae bacterium]